MPRKRVPKENEAKVLLGSKRRCALCFGLRGDKSEKRGQIAHIDRDASNSFVENLAYLCMDHHDQYDSTARQSKGLTTQELRAYRDQLYAAMAVENATPGIDVSVAKVITSEVPRVLVFENSSLDRARFARVLEGLAGLRFAVDSRNAEDLLLQNDPDLIIVDLNIDGSLESGLRVVRIVKSVTAAPVVICSKYVFSDKRLPRGLEFLAGAVECVVSKIPFPSAEELLKPLAGPTLRVREA